MGVKKKDTEKPEKRKIRIFYKILNRDADETNKRGCLGFAFSKSYSSAFLVFIRVHYHFA